MRIISLFIACFVIGALSWDNGLGKTPQMGWNSWNAFGCDIDQDVVWDAVAAFVKYNLSSFGYKYVNLDDCWAGQRDSQGNIQPSYGAFPEDMPNLAQYVHDNGLLFGLYLDAGTTTCAGRPGSFGFEDKDAATMSQWGVDYVKYDNCNGGPYPAQLRFTMMSKFLHDRNIFFSMCPPDQELMNFTNWTPETGNSWRTTLDISDNFQSMLNNLDNNDVVAGIAGPGGWNDPDMLEVGNGGMNYTEYVTHFSMWCLVKAPLILGCDLTMISHADITIVTNAEAIAVNQDPLGIQGRKLVVNGSSEVWGGPLSNNRFAMALLNRNGSIPANITAVFAQLNLTNASGYNVRDLWAHKDLGVMTTSVSQVVPPHGVFFAVLSPATVFESPATSVPAEPNLSVQPNKDV